MDIPTIARSYLGQKEISGNKGFIDKAFEKKMISAGWYKGAAWCLFFARLVWKEAGQNIKLISPSSKSCIDLATKAKNWHAEPVVGAIAIFASFKNGKRLSTGHGCIVTEASVDNGTGMYTTVDGNTTDKGGREGILVAVRYRHLNKDSWTKKDGLRLMGFIYPESGIV